MSPRHCMVVHAAYPIGETRVQREALALVDAGVEVDVLCLRSPGEPPHETLDGVSIRRLPVQRDRSRGLAGQMIEYLRFFVLAGAVLSYRHLRRRYDTVQVHNLPDFLVFCALVPRLTGSAVLLDLHDLMPEFFASKTGHGLGHPIVRLVALQERLSCRFATRVITVTDEWRRTLGQRAVPIERVEVVMNLADPRVFRGCPRDFRDGDGLRVLYHGTFTHRYGVDLIIRAVGDIVARVPGIHLELIGDGDARAELVRLVDELDLGSHVTLSQGMIDASELPRSISRADVGVVANRSDIFTDGLLPTKLLEYVAMGTPVLTARTPGISAYFDDSMVEFFEPGDAASLAEHLEALQTNRLRLNDLAVRAARFNHEHDWDRSAESYTSLVKELAGR